MPLVVVHKGAEEGEEQEDVVAVHAEGVAEEEWAVWVVDEDMVDPDVKDNLFQHLTSL